MDAGSNLGDDAPEQKLINFRADAYRITTSSECHVSLFPRDRVSARRNGSVKMKERRGIFWYCHSRWTSCFGRSLDSLIRLEVSLHSGALKVNSQEQFF